MSNCPQVGGLLTRRAAQETDSYTLSLTLGDESVTRLSRRAAEVLRDDALILLAACSHSKAKIFSQAIFGTALASPRELAKRSTVNGVVAGGLEIIDEAAAAAAAAAAAEEGRALGPHGDGSLAMAAGLEALIMDPAAAPEEKFAAGEAFAVGSFARETVQRLR